MMREAVVVVLFAVLLAGCQADRHADTARGRTRVSTAMLLDEALGTGLELDTAAAAAERARHRIRTLGLDTARFTQRVVPMQTAGGTADGGEDQEALFNQNTEEGGTSVILSNHNSVEHFDDNNKAMAVLKIEERKKQDERRRLDDQREERSKLRKLEHERKAHDEGAQKSAQVSQMQQLSERRAFEQKQKERAEFDKEQKRAAEDAKHVLRKEPFELKSGEKLVEAKRLPWSDAFTYMFWIRPDGIEENWGGILHRGKENTHRSPAFWFYPGKTRMHIRVSSEANWNTGADPERELPQKEWTNVALVVGEGKLTVYYNGEVVISADFPHVVKNEDDLFACGEWYRPAKAQLADLRYYQKPLEKKEINRIMSLWQSEQDKLQLIVKGRFTPQRGRQLVSSSRIPYSEEYAYLFWVKVDEAVDNDFSSVLHRGSTNRQRSPGIWFLKGKTKMAFAVSTADDWNTHGVPDRELPAGQWTHVALVVSKNKMQVFYDGAEVLAKDIATPDTNNGDLFCGDPWYPPARAMLQNLRYYQYAPALDEIKRVMENEAPTEKEE